ncbi:MAG: ATP synthase F0 subunit B [Zetaproteobacteria bacterium CG_4_9_14_3_um_filter_49_83]|nr:MAG: ATP synthase F0 subunit B [Zetaproteobacteria bacterium CG1_02_49_23]PIQ30065.1 MAG: ATP synthase F0 subunit B [Zetaproteobacteria bacterium CG17_big_fil_post_rev_8_21_14_2_50_50_13]PIV29193.1 MAG: ATP synthase F0 subunit B [Zetaproteobacteria bacterium CG02_land_8_20_14_3_00_50_9]PIY55987.1 MAG: ATP synthase F0 subunit B [Zetaproteobacteria bacterium CG_4_10_14_0_8_um_filter_49_80]PJA36337.1 MAG: ATP synthase F0 subunit B [Zetaproteobacteria bacterium CG_4_9_14_3_um_filter_49_83]
MSIDLTFVLQIVVFLTMVGLLWKFLYGPLNEAMDARAKKIEDGLAAADAGVEAMAKAQADIANKIEEAKQTAHSIVVSAEKRAAELAEEATLRARKDADAIVVAGKEELAAEVSKARQQLRAEVVDVALLAAGRIVEAELDAKRHEKIINDAIQQGFGNA